VNSFACGLYQPSLSDLKWNPDFWRTAMTNSCRLMDHSAHRARHTRWFRVVLIGVFAAFSCGLIVAQEGADNEIVWNKMFRLPDGRLFVTDGALMMDVELAKPRVLPGTELPASTGEVMSRQMAAERQIEIDLDDLERGTQEQTYEAPNGLPFAAKYVEFLQEAVPDASLRIGGDREPVVIVSDGKSVGLVMAKARVTPP
jgi:hypothetical protein